MQTALYTHSVQYQLNDMLAIGLQWNRNTFHKFKWFHAQLYQAKNLICSFPLIFNMCLCEVREPHDFRVCHRQWDHVVWLFNSTPVLIIYLLFLFCLFVCFTIDWQKKHLWVGFFIYIDLQFNYIDATKNKNRKSHNSKNILKHPPETPHKKKIILVSALYRVNFLKFIVFILKNVYYIKSKNG